MVRRVIAIILMIIGIVLLLLPATPTFTIGLIFVFLGSLVFAQAQDQSRRARWILVAALFFLAGIIAFLINLTVGSTFDVMQAHFVAIVGGLIGGFILWGLLVVMALHISANYLLALEHSNEATLGEAIGHLLNLILNRQDDFIVIKGDGTEEKTKKKGKMKKFGGPGKLIVEPGLAVMLQKGGTITRVVGPGSVTTKPREHIRSIFDLRPRFKVQLIENVLTADQIPLKIELGIGYRLVPADSNTPKEDLLVDNLDMIKVAIQTIHRAELNNTAGGGWQGVAENAPIAALRDLFMVRNFNSIFPEDGSDPHERVIEDIETAIKETLNQWIENNGVIITAIDIRHIEVSDEEAEAARKARAEVKLDQQRNQAIKDSLQDVIDTVKQAMGKDTLDTEDLRFIENFVKMQQIGKMNGTAVINVDGAQSPPINFPQGGRQP